MPVATLSWRTFATALTLGALALVAALAFRPAPPPPAEDLSILGKPGHDDDPSARIAWEIQRYADPETGEIPAGIRSAELAFASTLPKTSESSRLSPWTLRGPLGLGGRTRALGVDVSNPDVVLAGGVSGGMWRSTDGALTWTKTSGPLQLQSVTTLAQDTRAGRTDRWYYGTGEFRANSASGPSATYRGDGLYTSADGGQSWVPLASTVNDTPGSSTGEPFDFVWRLATDPIATEDVVYAATWLGIYRSADGGATWDEVLGQGSGAADVAVAADGTVYATLQQTDAYWRSDDGITWTSITPTGLLSGQNRTVIAVAPSDPSIVYFVGDHGSGYDNPRTVFYRYDDATGTMDDRSANAQSATGGIQSYIQYCLGATVHPVDPDVVYIAGVDNYRTDDAFASATVRFIGDGHADNHSFVFADTSGDVLYIGSDGGVHRTTAPLSGSPFWADRNNGYTTSQFYDLALDPLVGGNRLLGGLQDNGSWLARSADSDDWRKLQGGDGAYSAFTSDPDQVIVSFQNGEMRRRTYNAAGTEVESIDIKPPTTGFQFIHPLDIDPVGLEKFYTFTNNDLWINPDISAPNAANTWSEVTNAVIGSISNVTAAHTPSDRVWLGTTAGRVYRVDDVFSDTPVIERLDPSEFPSGTIVQFATHPTDPDEVLVAFSNYNVDSVWRTTDGGATWSSISGNLEETPGGAGAGPSVRSVGILPTPDGAIYYSATSAGIYSTATLDGDDTVWELEAPDLIGYLVVQGLQIRHEDNTVAVATHGGGMFSTQALPVAAGEAPVVRDLSVSSYPNPSAGRAQISVQSERAARLRVDLYDARGRLVSTLHNAPVAAGGGVTVPLNGLRLPAGRYVVRARAGDRVETTAVTIVR